MPVVRNSIIVAGGATALSLVIAIFCGYALSRFHASRSRGPSAAPSCCRR
jgi:ABC-type glycerol-3-phosphate transport system permease component